MTRCVALSVIVAIICGCSHSRVQTEAASRKGYLVVRENKSEIGCYEVWCSDERLILDLLRENPGSNCIVVDMESVMGGPKEIIVGMTLPDSKIVIAGKITNLTKDGIGKVIVVP